MFLGECTVIRQSSFHIYALISIITAFWVIQEISTIGFWCYNQITFIITSCSRHIIIRCLSTRNSTRRKPVKWECSFYFQSRKQEFQILFYRKQCFNLTVAFSFISTLSSPWPNVWLLCCRYLPTGILCRESMRNSNERFLENLRYIFRCRISILQISTNIKT